MLCWIAETAFPMNRSQTARVALLLLCILSGCAVKGRTPAFSAAHLPEFSPGGEVVVPDRWWREFNDDGLNRQVNLALGQNFDLATAMQRLRAARATTRRAESDLFWDVNGVGGTSHTFQPQTNQTRTRWGMDAAFQVDLWGRIESQIEAERLRAEATREDYQTVALTLAAEVARTWYALIESHAQLTLLGEQLQTNLDGLKAVELRFATGGEGGSPNVLRQRQLVESTREQETVVRASIATLEHQLAVLTGQPAQTATYEPGSTLPGLPGMPFVGLPADLLGRRPDVKSDYFSFSAADRDLEVAVTEQYPRLDLTGSLLNSADRSDVLFRDWFLSLGGQLVGPILDGGQRRAEIDRRRAIRDQRFHQYRQTVLIALQEVEDGLALEGYQLQRIERIRGQLGLAQQASDQLRQRFITGDASFLDILSAIQSQQRLQRSLLSASLDLILIRIGLYLALAGDFDTLPMDLVELPEGTSAIRPRETVPQGVVGLNDAERQPATGGAAGDAPPVGGNPPQAWPTANVRLGVIAGPNPIEQTIDDATQNAANTGKVTDSVIGHAHPPQAWPNADVQLGTVVLPNPGDQRQSTPASTGSARAQPNASQRSSHSAEPIFLNPAEESGKTSVIRAKSSNAGVVKFPPDVPPVPRESTETR